MSKSFNTQLLGKGSGIRCINELLSRLTTKTNVETVASKIAVYVENFDIYNLVFVYKQIFADYSKQDAQPIYKQQLIQCCDFLTERFLDSRFFRPIVFRLFNSMKDLPTEVLSKLKKLNALALLVFSQNSAVFPQAVEYIKSTLIPSLKPKEAGKINEKVLFELSKLNLENFNLLDYAQPPLPMSLSLFSDTPSVNMKLALSISNPCLYDAVIESDPRSLISPDKLDRLFSFFPDFNESHAAAYLTAISSSSCSFKQFFGTLEEMQCERVISLINSSFTQRGVDSTKIVNFLDQPNLKALDKDGCAMLLNLLMQISKNKIDAHPFVTKWKNEEAQCRFLLHLSTNPSSVVFKSCRNVPQETITRAKIETSGNPSQCWLCIDFVERFIELADQFPKLLEADLQQATPKFSTSMFLSVALMESKKPKRYTKFTNDLFSTLILAPQQEYFEEVWRIAPKFLISAIINFSHQAPQKLPKIAETFTQHLNELLNSDDLEFSIDLAFHAAMRSSLSIESYIDNLVKKFTQSVLPTLLQFVKIKVMDSQQTFAQLNGNVLNLMFKWFSTHFKELSADNQLLTNAVYSICESIITKLNKYDFAKNLPSVKAEDTKKVSEEYFTKFFRDELSLSKFLQIFHQLRGNSQPVFESICTYLLLELYYVKNHETRKAIKLGELIGNMVNENLFTEQQLNAIFTSFHQTYVKESESSTYAFTSSALNICYTRLTKIPVFLFNILKQPQFKTHEPQLYQKMKKISLTISAPIQLSQTTKLDIHPKIRRFEKLSQPPPKLCKIIQLVHEEPKFLETTIQSFGGYKDWLALHLVENIEDHPSTLQALLPHITANRDFVEIIIQAASFEVYNLIEKSSEISTYEGGFKRRRLSILGRLIGALTFARNRPLLSRYIDINQILLYALAQGKLFGVLPFVGAILRSCKKFFNPPNPYISGILQILASINSIDLLKLSIKNQISLIMSHFGVSSSQFIIIPLIPNLKDGNFDFITTPFSLSYIMSPTEIDRIVSCEESSFYSLASQHFIMPEVPGPDGQNKKEMFRKSLTKATLAFLKQEGQQLSKVASSTAAELIIKDFIFSPNTKLMYQTAETLTKQLSAGLTMFTVFQKQQIYLTHQVMHEFKPEDAEWVTQGVQLNHTWIGQLLKDVVHFKAWKNVQQRLEANEEQKKNHTNRHADTIAQKIRKMIPQSIAPNEKGLDQTHQQIYQDLSELSLSPAQISYIEKPGEKNIKQLEEFDAYFNYVSKLISSETPNREAMQEGLTENIAIPALFEKMPVIDSSFETFASVLRKMMKFMFKASHNISDAVFSKILEKIVNDAVPGYVTRVQPLIVSWLRNFIPSVPLLSEFLKTGLLTPKQLDRFFFDSLNRQPFNGRLFLFAIRFLNYTLVEKQLLKPSDMIDSISFAVSTPQSLIETISATNQQQIPETIDKLQKVLDTMDVPLNVLSPNSKLQSVAMFDPTEEIGDSDKIIEALKKWKETVDNLTVESQESQEETRECLAFEKDFFIYLFFTETEEVISNFITCVCELNLFEESFANIIGAIEHCIQGNGCVIGYDTRKYYNALTRVMNVVSGTEKLIEIAAMLHRLRPLQVPSFTFSWTKLISTSHFVNFLITNVPDVMKILLEDYIVAVTYAQSAQTKDAFDTYYRSLLRFILILVHDFPPFISSISIELVSLFGPHFTQLRNILLSSSEENLPPISSDPYSFNDFKPIHQIIPELVTEMNFEEQLDPKKRDLTKIVSSVEKRTGTTAVHSFIIFLVNKLAPGLNSSDVADQTKGNELVELLIEFFDAAHSEIQVNILHAFFDYLRLPGRVTAIFMRVIMQLFSREHKEGRPKLEEPIVAIALQRFSTPAPQPWGLRVLVRHLISDPTINIMEKPYVQQSAEVKEFAEAVKLAVDQ